MSCANTLAYPTDVPVNTYMVRFIFQELFYLLDSRRGLKNKSIHINLIFCLLAYLQWVLACIEADACKIHTAVKQMSAQPNWHRAHHLFTPLVTRTVSKQVPQEFNPKCLTMGVLAIRILEYLGMEENLKDNLVSTPLSRAGTVAQLVKALSKLALNTSRTSLGNPFHSPSSRWWISS